MGAIYSSKKFAEYVFDDSDKAAEEQSNWKSSISRKKKLLFGDSSVHKYDFLQTYAGGREIRGTKLSNETVIIDEADEVDEAVKERIFQSDAALQSSSSNYNSKTSSGCRLSDRNTFCHGEHFKTSKATPGRKDCLADNEPVSIILDDDNDNSSIMSHNDMAEAEGSSGERIVDHEITSHAMEPGVVVHPETVTYGRKRYLKSRLTFLCSSIKLDVSEEEESKDSLTSEWKTVDLISIESRWLDPFKTACVLLHIKSEHPKPGIVEVKFTVCDPDWATKQVLIKSLDEQYEEKWDVDLDSYDSFEDVIYLEGNCGSISISVRDFELLQPERFINDTIVDFYIEYLKKKIEPADERFHFFNSFFFRKLADFDENRAQAFDATSAFQRVRKWTKKVNIFQKDYIFIPVNFRLHWSLIIICHPGEVANFEDEELENSLKVPCILHMDSIYGSHKGLENCIQCYLWEEWKERNRDATEDLSTKFMNLRFLRLEVPQQQNSSDCALFMLHYIELFVKQAPNNFNLLTNFMSKDWFYPTEASLKRARIKRLIFELAKTNPQLASLPDQHSSDVNDVNDEEGDVEILHETYNSKENCGGSNSSTSARGDTPIMVKPLRSEAYSVNDEDVDINLMNSDTNGDEGSLRSSIHGLLQYHCEEIPDNEGIPDNEQNHGQLVLYDTSNVLSSPIKGSDDTEDVVENQVVVFGPLPINDESKKSVNSSVTCIDRHLSLLQLKEKENHTPLPRDEALVVEDSDDDDVCETHVVEDSDSDGSGIGQRKYSSSCYRGKFASSATTSSVAGNRSKRRKPVVCKTRKRLRSSSSDDLHIISLCE